MLYLPIVHKPNPRLHPERPDAVQSKFLFGLREPFRIHIVRQSRIERLSEDVPQSRNGATYKSETLKASIVKCHIGPMSIAQKSFGKRHSTVEFALSNTDNPYADPMFGSICGRPLTNESRVQGEMEKHASQDVTEP
jgi:hypothetical protein